MKFDDLSPEVILCIFDYLSAGDRYNAFFQTNSRLRHLVKKWTHFSRKDLYFDLRRFSTLHSWYKHLDFKDGGTKYYLFPRKGEQERYSFDPRVTDRNGLHWYFYTFYNSTPFASKPQVVRDILLRHPVRLNPFFYASVPAMFNVEKDPRSYHGVGIIFMRYRNELRQWSETNYPEIVKKSYSTGLDDHSTWSRDVEWRSICENEGKKALESVFHAAEQIWNELKEVNDINPMEILDSDSD